VHGDGDVGPGCSHEIVAEAHLGGEPDRVQDAIDTAVEVGAGCLACLSHVLGDRDIQLDHRCRGGELPRSPLGEAERAASASEQEVGTLALCQRSNTERE
jgi:hypothetical protein